MGVNFMSEVKFHYELIGPLYSIYVGSYENRKISNEQRRMILSLCENWFTSFTCIDAQGHFRGLSEETLIIQIATDDYEKIKKLAYQIAIEHGQLGIGIVEPGPNGGLVYGRVVPDRKSTIINFKSN
jgi:hypothetical protein